MLIELKYQQGFEKNYLNPIYTLFFVANIYIRLFFWGNGILFFPRSVSPCLDAVFAH